ncbi:MAG: sigma-70 family RNA polymerase sigma factor [Balneolales bacterium]
MTEKIWTAYRDKIYHYLNSKLRDPEQAEDLTQEIFVSILHKEQELKGIKNLDSWIYRVANNKLIDYTRKRKEIHLEPDTFPEAGSDSIATLTDNINSCLKRIIEEYDDQESVLLLDVFSGNLTQKEAARRINMPYSTLKSRVQKARNEIFKRFVDECCRLVHNRKGDIINCRPTGRRSAEWCN